MKRYASIHLVVTLCAQLALPTRALATPDGSTLTIDRGSTGMAEPGRGLSGPGTSPQTGAAIHSIPIAVAPGTAKMQPELALTYSSLQFGSSWVGHGWSLSPGSISRSGKEGVPFYDEFDPLQMDGVDIFATNLPGRFAERRQSYRRIERVGDLWEVRLTDGRLLRYGVDANSRIDAPPLGPDPIHAWLLAEEEDLNGNVIRYEYDETADAGQRYLKTIRYTLRRTGSGLNSVSGNPAPDPAVDRTIEFTLEDRPDVTVSHAAGFLQETSKRLAQIDVRVSGVLVRRYTLHYGVSPDTGRSLLESVEQHGSDADRTSPPPLPPLVTRFAYGSNVGNPALGVPERRGFGSLDPDEPGLPASLWQLPAGLVFTKFDRQDGGVRLAELNGDGLVDVIREVKVDDAQENDAESHAYLNRATGFDSSPTDSHRLPLGADGKRLAFINMITDALAQEIEPLGTTLIDLNGDGRGEAFRLLAGLEVDPADCGASTFWEHEYHVRTDSGWDPIVSSSVHPGDGPGPAIGGTLGTYMGLAYKAGVYAGDGAPHIVGGSAEFSELNGDGRPDLIARGEELLVDPNGSNPLPVRGRYWVSALHGLYGPGYLAGTSDEFEICDDDSDACLLESVQAQTQIGSYAATVAGSCGSNLLAYASFALGKRQIDVNGDGLDDHVAALTLDPFWASGLPTDNRDVFLNQGGDYGPASDPTWELPSDIAFERIDAAGIPRDQGVRLADLNGDGRPDLIRAAGSIRRLYLATGNPNQPWAAQPANSPWRIPGGMQFVDGQRRDRGVRFADLNGDGMVDLIRSFEGVSQQVLLNTGKIPDLLEQIVEPKGGTRTYSYEPSTRFDHTGSDDVPDLPQVLPLVKSVETDDLFNPPVRTTFNYSGGVYAPVEREFRGFRLVEATREADGRKTETEFYQDEGRAGRVERERIRDDQGNLLLETVYTYTEDDLPGLPLVHLPEDVWVYEYPPPGTPGQPRITLKRTSYERGGTSGNFILYGRVSEVTEFGEVNSSGVDLDLADTRTNEIEYLTAEPDRNIVRVITKDQLKSGDPGGSQTLVRENRFFYDEDLAPGEPSRARLTTHVAVLDEPGSPDPTTTFEYDEFGNLRKSWSPRVNAGESNGGPVIIDYDSILRTFPVKLTNPKGHETRFDHSPDGTTCADAPPFGSGLVYAVQGPNDTLATRALRCYDAFGRNTLDRGPSGLTEVTTAYDDTVGASRITTTEQISSTASRSSVSFLDGLGRGRRVETEGPQGTTIVAQSELDAAGRVHAETLPFFDVPAPVASHTFYDTLDRVVRVERPAAPVGSPSEQGLRVTQVEYDRGWVTVTDANSNVRRRQTDAFGNTVRVEEVSGTEGTLITRYEYDVTGNLVEILDHGQNKTTIGYDLLGRRDALVDPDLGTHGFIRDSGGNVTTETGPNGTVILDYDELDRLLARTINGTLETTLAYDTAPQGIGLLASATDETGAGVYSALAYDGLGRVLEAKREIDGFSFAFATSFDSYDRAVERTLPNGRVVTRSYDPKGYLTAVESGGLPQVSDVEQDAMGRISRYQTANGITMTLAFEANTRRPRELRVEGSDALEHREYAFDLGDRIQGIDDLLPTNRDYAFQYDSLDRLKLGTGPYAPGLEVTTLHYSYSAIGNLECLDSAAPGSCAGGRELAYPTSGTGVVRPHAPVSVDGLATSYTASGSLQLLGSRTYDYDSSDRLQSVSESGVELARFTYTASGSRIKTVDLTGRRAITEYLLSRDFEFDATRELARTHLTLQGQVVGTLVEPFAPTAMSQGEPVAPVAPPRTLEFVLGLVLLALAMLGLQLLRLRQEGVRPLRPAVAGGTVIAFLCVSSVPGVLWAAPLDGDLNGDGRLDAADALIATQIASQTLAATPQQMESGDVAPLEQAPTAPSEINSADALLILRAVGSDDVDGDSLDTDVEIAGGASPFRADTDGDGLGDPEELAQGSDPRVADTDGDGLADVDEYSAGTDPSDPDTDGDGLPDDTDGDPLRGAVFLHADVLGSTLLVTGESGAVVQRVAYRPYGESVSDTPGSPAVTPRFGFTGQRFEDEVGIYDYGARFYDPALGRFLQADSIVPDPFDPQSLNRYSYTRNNPINRIDPSGNWDFGGFFSSAFSAVGDFFSGIGSAISGVSSYPVQGVPGGGLPGPSVGSRGPGSAIEEIVVTGRRQGDSIGKQILGGAAGFIAGGALVSLGLTVVGVPGLLAIGTALLVADAFTGFKGIRSTFTSIGNVLTGRGTYEDAFAAGSLLGGLFVGGLASGRLAPRTGGAAGARTAIEDATGVGRYAGESIPARSTGRGFSTAERAEINRIGTETGCHTCGTTNPGTKSGNFVPDHQPPSALNSAAGPQRLYPQCIDCSRNQGLAILDYLRGRNAQ